MNRKLLLSLWGGLFVSCAALGFVQVQGGVLKWLMLLRGAKERRDCAMAALVRNIAAGSLALTLMLLVANVLSLRGSVALGNVLNVALAIVSTPMFCGQSWALTLFCWAFVMIAAHKLVKQIKKTQT